MPSAIDVGFVLFFSVAVMLFESMVFMPRFKARVAAGEPDARMKAYRRTIIGQWLIAAIGLGIWISYGRAWRPLGLVPPDGARRWYGAAILLGVVSFYAVQLRAVHRFSAEERAAFGPRLASVEFILPHRSDEYPWFMALSVTAGVCEELLYRGYLMWVLGAFMNVWLAVVAAAVLFGVAHAYQGRTGILKTGAVGIVMGVIVVVSGWIVPAMIVHAIVDVAGGDAGYTILRREPA